MTLTTFEMPSGPSLARPATWRAALVSLAMVAALVHFGFFFFRTPTSTAWGWNEQELFAGSPTADEQVALKQLCRMWLGEFIDVEFDLRRDRITPREARDAMDRIVDKLVERLRSLRLT